MNSVFTLSFIVMLVLKLLGMITVSWWVVFSPLIVGFILFFVLAMFAVLA